MIYICGRRVKVQTGTKSQTINICTEQNINGLYDYIVRLQPPFTSEADLLSHSFESLEAVVDYLQQEYEGKIEKSPTGQNIEAVYSSAHQPQNIPTPLKIGSAEKPKIKSSASRTTRSSRIFIPTTSPEDWQQLLADPDLHWRTGFSAKTLAYCWESAGGLPIEIRNLFQSSGIPAFQDVELLFAIPEHKVQFPPRGARPSQNDLFVLAKAFDGHLIAITVEGKVSESFDKTLGEWKKGMSDGKEERLSFIKQQLDLPDDIPNGIRYQLLHRTVSAIIEANRFNAQSAVMIVHSFSQHDRWLEDYQSFLQLFKVQASPNELVFLKNTHGINLYAAWARGNQRFLSV